VALLGHGAAEVKKRKRRKRGKRGIKRKVTRRKGRGNGRWRSVRR